MGGAACGWCGEEERSRTQAAEKTGGFSNSKQEGNRGEQGGRKTSPTSQVTSSKRGRGGQQSTVTARRDTPETEGARGDEEGKKEKIERQQYKTPSCWVLLERGGGRHPTGVRLMRSHPPHRATPHSSNLQPDSR